MSPLLSINFILLEQIVRKLYATKEWKLDCMTTYTVYANSANIYFGVRSNTGRLPSFEHWHEVIIECHKSVERFE